MGGWENCGLCGEFSKLKKSHLMPKSLYRIITRMYSPHDPAPVWISEGQKSAYYSSTQITKRLLCGACEDRFNKYGEKYVTGMCRINVETFELKRLLDGSSPSINVNGSSYFAPKDIPKLKSDKFMYFILSIVWRATAVDWGHHDMPNLSNTLKDEFKIALQNYLLHKEEFPKDIYISVCVDDDENPIPTMTLPTGSIVERMRLSFFIPGIKFNICFGAEADPELSYNLRRREINMIFMYRSFRESDDYQQIKALVGSGSSAKGKLAKSSNGLRNV